MSENKKNKSDLWNDYYFFFKLFKLAFETIQKDNKFSIPLIKNLTQYKIRETIYAKNTTTVTYPFSLLDFRVLDQNNFVGITTDKILKFDQDLKVSKESMLEFPTYPSITANKNGEIFIINSKYIFKLSKELTEMTTCYKIYFYSLNKTISINFII